MPRSGLFRMSKSMTEMMIGTSGVLGVGSGSVD